MPSLFVCQPVGINKVDEEKFRGAKEEFGRKRRKRIAVSHYQRQSRVCAIRESRCSAPFSPLGQTSSSSRLLQQARMACVCESISIVAPLARSPRSFFIQRVFPPTVPFPLSCSPDLRPRIMLLLCLMMDPLWKQERRKVQGIVSFCCSPFRLVSRTGTVAPGRLQDRERPTHDPQTNPVECAALHA